MTIREALASFAEDLLLDEPLAKYTAARLGGAADAVYVARDDPDALVAVMQAAWSAGVPVRVLGRGANVLVSDRGVRGLVVVNRAGWTDFLDGNRVRAGGGTNLSVLAQKCANRGLSGFEWAVSVPGTLGGAVVNNAGAHGGDMAANLTEAVIVDAEGGKRTLTLADLEYDYRTSSLKRREDRRFLVLEATLQLQPGDPDAIKRHMDDLINYRKRTQPPGASLGSIFKNPPGDYAGRLIEACGLKGTTIGGAQVSPVHANFFINTGDATASDYRALVEQVRDVVKSRMGVDLQTEIEFVGEWF